MASSKLAPPPPGLDIYESDVAGVQACNWIPWAITTIVVIARFLSRKISSADLWWDDWIILPAYLLVTVATITTSNMMVAAGLGRHIWAVNLSSPGLELFWKGLYVNQVVYAPALACAKFSILLLYWRLFKRALRWWIIGAAAVVCAWLIAMEVVIFLFCDPLSKFWIKSKPGHCMNQMHYVLGSAVPNFLTDIFLLILPLPLVWKLKIDIRQKIMLSIVFIMGGFVSAVSITRFVILKKNDNFVSPDITWNAINGHNWTQIEYNAAIISACLPTLKAFLGASTPRKIYSYVTTFIKDPSSLGSSRNRLSSEVSSDVSHEKPDTVVQENKTQNSWTSKPNHDLPILDSGPGSTITTATHSTKPLSSKPTDQVHDPAEGPKDAWRGSKSQIIVQRDVHVEKYGEDNSNRV